MTFARRVFLTAGVAGLLLTIPQFFLEGRASRELPPAITHPEFYYGFYGVVLGWQVAFLVIGLDPARYRPLMLVSGIGKIVFAAAVPVLAMQGRTAPLLLPFAAGDLLLAALFLEAWRRSGGTAPLPPPASESRTLLEPLPGSSTDAIVQDFAHAVDRAGPPG
jgi:hypothetical protein